MPEESQKEREKWTDIKKSLECKPTGVRDIAGLVPRLTLSVHTIYFAPPLHAHNLFARPLPPPFACTILTPPLCVHNNLWHKICSLGERTRLAAASVEKYLTARTMDSKIADCLSENNPVYACVTFGVSTVK